MVCPKVPDEFLTKSAPKPASVKEPNSPYRVKGNEPCPGCGFELKHKFQTSCPRCGGFLIWENDLKEETNNTPQNPNPPACIQDEEPCPRCGYPLNSGKQSNCPGCGTALFWTKP